MVGEDKAAEGGQTETVQPGMASAFWEGYHPIFKTPRGTRVIMGCSGDRP